MENEVLREIPYYEGLTAEEIDERYSDLELKIILQRVFNMDSTVYFIGKEDKIRYITKPDERSDVLEQAETKRSRHRDRNRESAKRKTVAEMIEEKTGDAVYRYLGVERPEGGFTDEITERSAQIAYLIERVSDGEVHRVARGTVRNLLEAERLEGFDASLVTGRKSVAHEAGKTTLADRRISKVPLDKVPEEDDDELPTKAAAEEESEPEPDAEEEKPEKKADSSTFDQELDDILNSIPS